MIQVVRQGAECWTLTRVTLIERGMHEYETIARVVRSGALYYVEFAEWQEESYTWVRQPRGYLLPRPAFKVAARGPVKPEVV